MYYLRLSKSLTQKALESWESITYASLAVLLNCKHLPWVTVKGRTPNEMSMWLGCYLSLPWFEEGPDFLKTTETKVRARGQSGCPKTASFCYPIPSSCQWQVNEQQSQFTLFSLFSFQLSGGILI